MECIRADSSSARLLIAAARDPFTLIDVGCSGGIDAGWRIFADQLRAYGFDPGQAEIERLRASETHPHIRYVNAFVGLPLNHPLHGAAGEFWRYDPWGRLSAYRTQTLQKLREAARAVLQSAAQPEPQDNALQQNEPAPAPAGHGGPALPEDSELMRRNRWIEATLADPTRPLVLPQFLAHAGVEDLDFIKIDVDGKDFEILRSLDETLNRPGVLGVMIEVSFHGGAGPHFNSFHNVDRFMREHGYDLLDLTVRRYSLAAMPRPYLFANPFAAQTTGGRPFQGDALYLRDVGYPHRPGGENTLSPAKLLKLAALYCLFGLLDHAAEILLLHQAALEGRLDVEAALDALMRESQDLDPDHWSTRFATYREMIEAFERDDPEFYGADDRRRTLGEAILASGRAGDQACSDMAALATEHRQTQAGLEAWMKRCREAEAEIDAMRMSLSWRLTRGLRIVRQHLKSSRRQAAP